LAYNECISTAQSNYSNNWTSNSGIHSKAAEASYRSCIETGLTASACREINPVVDAQNCTLPIALAEQLENGLAKAKAACADEAKAGLL